MRESLLDNCERKERAHFAVGGCHSEEAEDIRKAMQKADARMYKSKEEYYSSHPEYEWHRRPVQIVDYKDHLQYIRLYITECAVFFV